MKKERIKKISTYCFYSSNVRKGSSCTNRNIGFNFAFNLGALRLKRPPTFHKENANSKYSYCMSEKLLLQGTKPKHMH